MTVRGAVASAHRPDPAPRDLDDRDQIAEMVRRFYADVAQDDLLGPMFNDVARVDWPEHLERLTAFWCRALLSQPGYAGNPYRAHQSVHERSPFTAAHFERWLNSGSDRAFARRHFGSSPSHTAVTISPARTSSFRTRFS